MPTDGMSDAERAYNQLVAQQLENHFAKQGAIRMTVQSKWQCVSVTKRLSTVWDSEGKKQSGFTFEYEFQVVIGNSPEDKQFFASTPFGQMKMGAVRDDLYQPGKYYYFNSTEATS